MSEHWQAYLAGNDKTSRMTALKQLKASGEFIPIAVSEDLFCINLDPDEKALLLDLTSSSDKLELEHFLTLGAQSWEQNLAAMALRKWAAETQHLLWFRLLAMMRSPILAQRIRYTILDLAPYVYGRRLLELTLASDGLPDFSPAFHGLLLNRCLQWDMFQPELDALARRCMQDVYENLWPDHKALPAAIMWLLRYDPNFLLTMVQDRRVPPIWRDHLKLVCQQTSFTKKDEQALRKFFAEPGSEAWPKFLRLWPNLAFRHQLGSQTIQEGIEFLHRHSAAAHWPEADAWEFLAGVPEEVLLEAIVGLDDAACFATGVRLCEGLVARPPHKSLIARAISHLTRVSDPQVYLSGLSARLRLSLHEGSEGAAAKLTAKNRQVLEDEKRHIDMGFPLESTVREYGVQAVQHDSALDPDEQVRREFFNLAYRGKKIVPQHTKLDSFWGLLSKNWYKPSDADLNKMATLARQAPKIYHSCYLHTLARFTGVDAAALKLLDYIRTTSEHELQEVIQALGGIGTSRASQELIAAITRPNVTAALQLEICQILADKDLHALQGELRSAIADLQGRQGSEAATLEVKESLIALLHSEETLVEPVTAGPLTLAPLGAPAERSLDEALSGKIPHYQQLSSEVRRALRTAQFFHTQVAKGDTAHAIDLSPVIDMQYKALELIFRECFEDVAFKYINQGVLQRKLDVIGYARPIPKAMDDYENFIGNLPVIRDIPYFSKFKLRKMLRAICQYRPGRRFTLDGIKAFALFFLCFGRKKCPYGLAEVVPLAFGSDQELAEFCRLLHVFQDFRNRAAHEGFRPDASNDMAGIWQSTAQIISIVYKIKDPLQNAIPRAGGQMPVHQAVVITKMAK